MYIIFVNDNYSGTGVVQHIFMHITHNNMVLFQTIVLPQIQGCVTSGVTLLIYITYFFTITRLVNYYISIFVICVLLWTNISKNKTSQYSAIQE